MSVFVCVFACAHTEKLLVFILEAKRFCKQFISFGSPSNLLL